jgi:hypothetical protein
LLLLLAARKLPRSTALAAYGMRGTFYEVSSKGTTMARRSLADLAGSGADAVSAFT